MIGHRLFGPLLIAALAAGCITQDVTPDRSWSFSDPEPSATTFGPMAPITPVTLGSAPAVAGGQDAGAAPGTGTGGQDQPELPDLLELLTPATPADLEPDLLGDQPPSPFHRLGHDTVRGMDGSWSKMYLLKSERSLGVLRMMGGIVPDFPDPGPPADQTGEVVMAVPPEGPPTEIVSWVLHKDFYKDSTEKFTSRQGLDSPTIADLLVVTAPPATLVFIDELLDKLLADLPQIELEVRVVEINLDDLIDWDAKVGIKKLVDPSMPFDATTNPPSGNFGKGFGILDGGIPTGYGAGFGSISTPTGLIGFLMSLQGVKGDVQVDTLISLLQTIGASELIQAPTITVLNGHRALLNTGRKVPVFQASGVGSNIQITNKFEDVGVLVEMIPFIVANDVVRVDISVNVSAVTGEVPFNLGGTDVATPIISTRDAGTTVHVHSGQTFVLGGLRSRDRLETITKTPFLADIPIIGWLFKSRASRQVNSEILFFITPRIRIPSETLVAPIGP